MCGRVHPRRLQTGGANRYAVLRADPADASRTDEELLEQVRCPASQFAFTYLGVEIWSHTKDSNDIFPLLIFAFLIARLILIRMGRSWKCREISRYMIVRFTSIRIRRRRLTGTPISPVSSASLMN